MLLTNIKLPTLKNSIYGNNNHENLFKQNVFHPLSISVLFISLLFKQLEKCMHGSHFPNAS